MSEIELVVDKGAKADAARFFDAGRHLVSLLDSLAQEAGVEWEITGLRIGSAVGCLAPAGEHVEDGQEAVRSAVSGLRSIRNGDGAPEGWTPDAIRHATDLARVAGDHATLAVDGDVVYLDDHLRERLTTATPWSRAFEGSIRGVLTGVNMTRGNRASIRPDGGGPVVRVSFDASLAPALGAAFMQFVEVDGLVHQDADGRNYRVAAESVRVVEEAGPWADLWGIAPELGGDMTPRQYLEEVIRGEAW